MEESRDQRPDPRPEGSWGVIIVILIILAIVVTGAYYAFTDRLESSPTRPAVEATAML